MHYININGNILPATKASVPMDNGAFRYGYGLFETMLVKEGCIEHGDLHMRRLAEGLQQLMLQLPALSSIDTLPEQILKTVEKNGMLHLCRVRLEVYAGGGGIMGHDVAKAGYMIECYALNEEAIAYNENGLVAGVVKDVMKSADRTANLKTCNALVYALAARQARENKWNDALVMNSAGHIIESSIANIMWVKDRKLYTPPLSEGCVAGVMRAYIMTQVDVTEQALTYDTLMAADEVLLINAIKRIKWVRTIDGTQYVNTVSRSLSMRLFKK